MSWQFWLTLIVALGSLGFAVYTHLHNRPLKRLHWAIHTIPVVSGYQSRWNKLEVRYDQEVVEQISVSRIALWNSGNGALMRQDLPEGYPLRVVAEGDASLLSVEVLTSSQPSNEFSADLGDDDRSAEISFQYLNPQQGAVIEVIHTGRSDTDLAVIGDIVGLSRLTRRDTPSTLLFAAYLIAPSLGIPFALYLGITGAETIAPAAVYLLMLVLLGMLVALLYVVLLIRSVPRSLLDAYEPAGEANSRLDLARRSVLR